MTEPNLTPELKAELEREAEKHINAGLYDSGFEFEGGHKRVAIQKLITFAQSDIARKIHTQGYISTEESERVGFKKECRRSALTIQSLAIPVDPNHDPMTRTMFDLLNMVLQLTNDINISESTTDNTN